MTNLTGKFTLEEINLQARTCIEKGDYQGALGLLDQALTGISEADGVSRAIILSNRGFVLAGVKNYPEAIESFRNAAALFKAQGHPVDMAMQLGNMGSVFRDEARYDQALTFYHDALSVLKEQGHQPGIADQLSNIAYAHTQKKEFASALENFNQAKDLYIKLGKDGKAGLCRENIAALESMEDRDGEPIDERP